MADKDNMTVRVPKERDGKPYLKGDPYVEVSVAEMGPDAERMTQFAQENGLTLTRGIVPEMSAGKQAPSPSPAGVGKTREQGGPGF